MNFALMVLRVVVGALFIGHGSQKLFGVFGGGGPAGTAEMFERLELRPGHRHALMAGGAEFFGGALLALGLLTPLAAAILIAVMTAAVITVHAKNGIWNSEKGFEYNLVLSTVAFAIACIGAGSWSIDSALGLGLGGVGWGLAALGVGLLGGIGAVVSGRLHRRGETHGPTAHPA
jgi:putative oxidoreductase